MELFELSPCPLSKESFRLLIDACRNSVPALPMLVYTMSVITLLSSSAIYLVESRDNIPSMPLALQDSESCAIFLIISILQPLTKHETHKAIGMELRLKPI